MSVQECERFLLRAYEPGEIQQQMKAVTGLSEVRRLGARHGFRFELTDVITASSTMRPPPAALRAQPVVSPSASELQHHEYNLADLPGFGPVIAELPNLKIRPGSVDLAAFQRQARRDDLDSTSRSPAEPGFSEWHREMMADHWSGGQRARRDFHLINLDDHVDHPDYPDYFEAKTRVIAALEEAFRAEIRFSGSLWYPPSSYRLWHTNENQPGWRMYVIDLDEEFENPDDTSFFRYMNPYTQEIVTLPERRMIARFFRIEQEEDRLFWHCIVNPTNRNRWSFGFAVPENWMDSLLR